MREKEKPSKIKHIFILLLKRKYIRGKDKDSKRVGNILSRHKITQVQFLYIYVIIIIIIIYINETKNEFSLREKANN